MNDFIKINKVEILENYCLKIIFSDDLDFIFDLKKYFTNNSAFLILKDKTLFSQVTISNDGRSLVFPNDLDFCADSLWIKANKISALAFPN